MDFLVFGDDWNGHVSTTKHLIRHFSGSDRVVWVDSIGMRSPKMTLQDLKRIIAKAWSIMGGRHTRPARSPGDTRDCVTSCTFTRVSPLVIPFHQICFCRKVNAWLLKVQISSAMSRIQMEQPNVLAANPAVVNYLSVIRYAKLAYLRLDQYAELPGVDKQLIRDAEPRMFDMATVIFATAQKLLPSRERWRCKSHYLPQGVDIEHFGRASIQPSRQRILGFFGIVAEWLDFALIARVAKDMPDWVLEFIGPIRFLPEQCQAVENIRWLPPVPYQDLPDVVHDWTCAWIPFQVSDLTESVNPLKIREYLAAGIASHCTPLPEVQAMKKLEGVFISDIPREITEWMKLCLREDSKEKRMKIRDGVADGSWSKRVLELQDALKDS